MTNHISAGKYAMKLTQKIYEKIKKNIITGKYSNGSIYFETEIADKLKVSRTPIREALVRLQCEGYIKLTPRRGMQVLPIKWYVVSCNGEAISEYDNKLKALNAANDVNLNYLKMGPEEEDKQIAVVIDKPMR